MGHVPSAETKKLVIEPFASALQKSEETGECFDFARWIYVPSAYCEYRYILGTHGRRPLVCIGVNPSTAEPNNLDNTLKSVARIAAANGFDSWVMLNVYAQRATRPEDMDESCNPVLHHENLEALRWVLEQADPGVALWAAWGAVIEKRAYLKECVRDMVSVGKALGAHWVCAGKCSVKGHPHHPLYLKKDEPIRDFDLEAYLGQLGNAGKGE